MDNLSTIDYSPERVSLISWLDAGLLDQQTLALLQPLFHRALEGFLEVLPTT
jgi:hypothetical protein